MLQDRIKPGMYTLFTIFTAIVLFIIDLTIPLGVAFGVSYIIVVVIATQIPYRPAVFITALICTALVVLGLIFSPEEGEAWKVLFNRILSVFSIWISVLLAVLYKHAHITNLETETKFQNLVEGSLQGIFVHKDFKPLFANQQCADIFGYSNPEEILALDSILEAFWVPEEQERIRDYNINRMAGRKVPTQYECRGKHKDGSQFWFENNTTIIEWEREKATLASIIDVTERKQADIALHDSNERFTALYIDAAIGMAIVSLEHRVMKANPAFCTMLGYSKEEIVDILFDDITHTDDLKISTEKHYQLISGKIHNYHFEKRYIHKHGHVIWGALTVSLVRDTNTTPPYAIAQVQDITERKHAEKLLEKSKALTELLHSIAVSTTVLTTYEQVIQETIKEICNFKGWPVGHAYLIDPANENKLISSDIWFTSDKEQFQEFKKISMGMTFMRGKGLPGRILQTQEPEWIVNIQHDRNIPRSNLINKLGLHTGIGFPILVDNQVKGVLEFFTEEKNEVDQLLFNELLQIGTQIGRCFEYYESRDELQKLSHAVESSSSAVIITDIKGDIEYVNPKFTEVTGYTKKEAIGVNPRILKSGQTEEKVYHDLWETILAGKEWKGEFHNRKKDGGFYWGRATISGIKDTEGNITHFIGIQNDVTQEYELSEQLSYQASHDALTGLINRPEFERRAERLLSTIKIDETEHALCFLDLDQFKIVNDTCGHTAGDELLHQISKVLQHEVRKRDTLARLGGDEFGILMEHCSLKHAHRVAKSLLKAVHDFQFIWEDYSFRVGVSIGLVVITETTTNLGELLKQADAACYMAKDLGRNRIHVYHFDDSDIAQRHGEMQWVTRIYRALEENKFYLYAQSIVPLDGSNDAHYELLIRMKDEDGKIISPGAFLPSAERYDLMEKLDSWVIEKTFNLLANNPDFLAQINFISINLSGQSLAENNVLDFIVEQLDKSEIDGEKICFEITETMAIANLSNAMKFISTLKELGCRFALDDFGSGLSSFGYLKNLRVDYLKIDGMFVKDIVDDPIDHAMVKSINEIGQVMGMQTIAEFVENDVIKGMLKEIGVNYAQGYGIGKPMPFDELLGRSNNVTDFNKSINK